MKKKTRAKSTSPRRTAGLRRTSKIKKGGQIKGGLEDFRGSARQNIGSVKQCVKSLEVFRKKVDNYLPQIYRFFSASLGKTWFKAGLAIIFILLIIATAASQKHRSLKGAQKELEKRHTTNEEIIKIERQITYWENLMAKRNGYRDGYLELAILNYRLGRILTAREYLEKAKELDPNSEMVIKMEKIIK